MAAPLAAQKRARAKTAKNFILPENVGNSKKPDFPLFTKSGGPLSKNTVQRLGALAQRSFNVGNISRVQMLRVKAKAAALRKARGLPAAQKVA